jgi:hypothetical protein
MDGFKNTTRMKYMDEGISSRPTDSSGRRATDADLGIAPGGQSPKKAKPVGPASAAVSKVLAGIASKAARTADPRGSVMAGEIKPLYRDRDRELIGKAARMADPRGAVMEGEKDRYGKGGKVMKKKGVPAYSGKPMVGRKTGGLMAMPKGKC